MPQPPRKPSAPVVALVTLLLMALVFLADWRVGTEISFSIFYLFPVAFAAWYAGRRAGLASAAACTALWLVNDSVLGKHLYSRPAIPYWNALMRGGYFVLACLALGEIKELLDFQARLAAIKGEMLSFVSHEFGNQLTILDMGLALLKGDEADTKDTLDVMARSLAIMKTSSANFLNTARLESGRFALKLEVRDLRATAEGAVELMTALARGKEITLEGRFPKEPVLALADGDALSLVLSNLVENAVKYTPSGGRVTVEVCARDGSAVVGVEDTGIGIAEEDRRKIFSGFYRAPAAAAAAKGFGIGLKVSADILASHGSALDLASEPGRGSRFGFRLPLEPGSKQARGAPD